MGTQTYPRHQRRPFQAQFTWPRLAKLQSLSASLASYGSPSHLKTAHRLHNNLDQAAAVVLVQAIPIMDCGVDDFVQILMSTQPCDSMRPIQPHARLKDLSNLDLASSQDSGVNQASCLMWMLRTFQRAACDSSFFLIFVRRDPMVSKPVRF